MSGSRIKNTTRNIVTGLLNRIVVILLPFINRTAVLWVLGAEFTGLSGLFSSILAVLSIAELGFNTAIVYSLYKPMAEGNEKKICEIVSLFRRIYNIIGTIVLVVGISVMPFLKYLIHGTYPSNINLYVLYLLYLMNSVISYYLFAYKECLLIADQRQDISNNIRTIVSVIVYIVQLQVLLFTKDYYFYLIIAIFGTVITNITIQFITKKRYSYYHRIKVSNKIPKDIVKQVKGLMVNKICDTFRNSFDSLIISSFIGLTATAIYGNYYYVYSSIYAVMLVICNAMGASVGNSIVEKSEEANYQDMMNFSLAFAWIAGWCTICLVFLFQPFMKVWVGRKLMLSTFDMILFCIYFYVINMNNIRNQYISGTGMWWKLKGSYIEEALSNLCLNFILGKLLGIKGVILATIITIVIFNFFQRNIILFENYFKNESQREFLLDHIYYVCITICAAFITYFLCIFITFEGISLIFARGIICLFVPNIIFYFGLSKHPRFKFVKIMLLRIVSLFIK